MIDYFKQAKLLTEFKGEFYPTSMEWMRGLNYNSINESEVYLEGVGDWDAVTQLKIKFELREEIIIRTEFVNGELVGYIRSFRCEKKQDDKYFVIILDLTGVKINEYEICWECGKFGIENEVHEKNGLLFSKCVYCGAFWYVWEDEK